MFVLFFFGFFLFNLKGLVWLFREFFSTNDGISLNKRQIPGSNWRINTTFFLSESSKYNCNSSGETEIC